MEDKILDTIVNTAFINFYTLSKKGPLRLSGFNSKDESHIGLLRIAMYNTTLYQIPVSVDIGHIRLFFLKLKYNWFKPCGTFKGEGTISCEKFMDDILKFYDIKYKNAFAEIFRRYYK